LVPVLVLAAAATGSALTLRRRGGALLLAGGSAVAPIAAGVGFGAGRALTAMVRYWSRGGEFWDRRLERTLTLLSNTACVAILAAVAALVLR
jgi:hypothetical protein